MNLTNNQVKIGCTLILVLTFAGIGMLYTTITECYDDAIVLDELECDVFLSYLSPHSPTVSFRVPGKPFDACGYYSPSTLRTRYTVQCETLGGGEWTFVLENIEQDAEYAEDYNFGR